MFYGTTIWTFIPTVVAATILFTWVHNNVNGSLLAMHIVRMTFSLMIFLFSAIGIGLGYVYILYLLIHRDYCDRVQITLQTRVTRRIEMLAFVGVMKTFSNFSVNGSILVSNAFTSS